MKTKFFITLIFLMILSISANANNKKFITNYSQKPSEVTAEGVFTKVCIDEIVYLMHSTTNKTDLNIGRGGLANYINKKTMTFQKCKVLNTKCFSPTKKGSPYYVKNKIQYCFKNFKEIQ